MRLRLGEDLSQRHLWLLQYAFHCRAHRVVLEPDGPSMKISRGEGQKDTLTFLHGSTRLELFEFEVPNDLVDLQLPAHIDVPYVVKCWNLWMKNSHGGITLVCNDKVVG